MFLGPIFAFGNYWRLLFVKHDEAENARSFELDREVWVMLLGYPEDLCSTQLIAKSMSSFRILVNWDDGPSVARVVSKVYINDEKKIPDFVKVNASLPTKARSLTVPCFVLKKSNVQELPDAKRLL